MGVTHAHARRPRTAGDDAWSHEFVRLYRQWYRPVVSLCRHCGGPSADAEAMAQEAFTRAWLAWDRFSPDRPFGPWIATIARRLCIDHRVRMERQAELGHHAAALSGPPVVHSAEGIAAAMDTAALADSILRTLPPRQRRVLELREIEGWSYEQIARVTGASVEGVRGTLRRARRSFKAAYARIESSLGALGVLLGRLREAVQGWTWARGEALSNVSRWASAELVGVLAPLTLLTATTAPAAVAAPPPATTTTVAAVPLPASTAPLEQSHPSARISTTAVAAGGTVRKAVEAGAAATGIKESVTWIAVSPSYDDDRTVYASGVSKCEISQACPVLYRSTDGGRSWARLPATGRADGQVMLPPAYPKDRRIFSAGVSELQVSEDGGSTFRTVALTHGAGAISPLFNNGDPRIFFGRGWTDIFMGAGMEYHDGDGVKPLSLTIPLGGSPENFVFSKTFASDGIALIGGTYMPPGKTVPESVVFECVHDECRTNHTDVVLGSPRVVGRSSGHPAALAATPYFLFRSPAAGAPFERIADFPGSQDRRQVVRDLIRLADGRLLLSIDLDQVHGRGRLFASEDDGDSWTPVTPGDDVAIDRLVQLPDGRLLGAGVVTLGGVYCSLDSGRTWAATCA